MYVIVDGSRELGARVREKSRLSLSLSSLAFSLKLDPNSNGGYIALPPVEAAAVRRRWQQRRAVPSLCWLGLCWLRGGSVVVSEHNPH